MADPENLHDAEEEGYDEEADGDFDIANLSHENFSSSEEDGDRTPAVKHGREKSQLGANESTVSPELIDLDSGDEATIQEPGREKRKQKQKRNIRVDENDNQDTEENGWRVRTRAMRGQAQAQAQANKMGSTLASVRGSTVDVDQMWEDMNRPSGLGDLGLPAIGATADADSGPSKEQKENLEPSHLSSARPGKGNGDKWQGPPREHHDMITIDEVYEYAGEVHSRKKTVPRSSAEATQWLSQRPSCNVDPRFSGDEPVRRPLRKISRFDPNLNNLEGFKKNWESQSTDGAGSKIQKLNTVEKSKLDWATHVDQEGLQEELNEHAKAKGGYLSRMDFLGQIGQRKDEEARRLRAKR